MQNDLITAQGKSDQNISSGNEATQESGIGDDKVIVLCFSIKQSIH